MLGRGQGRQRLGAAGIGDATRAQGLGRPAVEVAVQAVHRLGGQSLRVRAGRRVDGAPHPADGPAQAALALEEGGQRAAPYGDGEKILNTRDAVDAALQGLERLITRYADPDQGYTSRTAPQFVKMYVSDYDHLARVFEWSTSGEDDE